MLVDTANDRAWEESSYDALRGGPVDGFLFFGIEPPRRRRGARGEQIVVIDAEIAGHPSVRLDAEAGTDAVMAHLLELGHRRIGHLAASVRGQTFRRRRERIEAALLGAGIDPERAPRAASPITFEDARRAAHELLDARRRPDGDLRRRRHPGRRRLPRRARPRAAGFPCDVSVVGFDDLDFARVLDPPLTTVAADGVELGALAFTTLASRMAGERVARVQRVPVRLEVRGSTGPPR